MRTKNTLALILSFLMLLSISGCAEQEQARDDAQQPAAQEIPPSEDAATLPEAPPAEAAAPKPLPPASPPADAHLSALEEVITHADLAALPSDITDYSQYTTRYVSPAGSDSAAGTIDSPYATIGHALETAESGTVIYVRGGTYKTGVLTIDKSGMVVAAYPGEQVTIQRASVDNEWNMEDDLAFHIVGDVSDVVIDGLVIDGFEMGVMYGDPATQEHLIIKNTVFKDITDEGIGNTYPSHTTYLVDGLLVKNVRMENLAGIGLQCGDEEQPCAKNVLIQDMNVLGAAGQDDDTGYDSLALVNTDNVLIVDSYFSKAPGDALDFKATRVSVVNTVAADPNRNGMKFWNDGEMINCLVYRTGADAAVVFESENNGEFRMINSVLAEHNADMPAEDRRSHTMTIDYSSQGANKVILTNNIFYRMPGSISIDTKADARVDNNIFHMLEDWDWFIIRGETEYTEVDALNSQAWASGNLRTDPLFADTTTVWNLKPGSPAVNAGITVKGVDFDKDWKARPSGAGVDMGHLEQ